MCFVTNKDASQFSQWNVPIRTFLSYVQPSGYTNLKILTSSLNKYKLTTFSKLTPAESPHQARFPLIGDDVLCKCSDTLVHTKWPPFIKRLVATTKAKKIVMDVVLDPVLAGLYCGSPLIVVAILLVVLYYYWLGHSALWDKIKYLLFLRVMPMLGES